MKKITIVMLMVIMITISPAIVGATEGFVPRTSLPSNARTTMRQYIPGNNPYTAFNVGNCTWYAFGRAWEILGYYPQDLVFQGDAEVWYANNKAKYDSGRGGFPYSSDINAPELGAIAVWENTTNAYGSGGHVAVVESVSNNSDGTKTIRTSDSGYGSYYFGYWTNYTSNSRLGLPSKYKFLGYIYILRNGNNLGYNPQGCIDYCSSDSPGKVTIRGWAFDRDVPDKPINIHVYVGGPAGTTDAFLYIDSTSVFRQDVNNAYNLSGNHGFEYVIDVPKEGTQEVYIYAINEGGGTENTFIDKKTVNITAPEKTPVQGSTMSQGYGKTIEDGNYIIVPAKYKNSSSFYYLDIEGEDKPAKNQTNVSLWGPSVEVDPVDTWTVKYEGNGFYSIKQNGYNVSLDVYGASTTAGGNIVAYKNNDSDAQRWSISPNGNGYRIQAKCSGFSLDVTGGHFEASTNIMQWENNNEEAQRWAFIPYKMKVDVPISFDLDGGIINGSSTVSSVTGTVGTGNYNDLSFMIPTKTCYTFMGWYADDGAMVYKSDGWCVNDGKYFENFNLIYSKPFTVHAHWNGPNHDWNNYYSIDKEATSTSEGQKSIHCSRCNAIKSGSTVVIPVTSQKSYVSEIKLSADPSTTIYAGKKTTINVSVLPSTATNKKLSWKSSNKNYATVNSNGVVTTKKAGAGKTVTITAKAKDGSGKTAKIKIKIVKDGVTKISLKGGDLTVGQPLYIKAKVKGGKTANKKLTWKSSNTKYASVDNDGVVTAKSEGIGKTVTITAYATDGTGKKAKIKLKIK